MFCYCGFRIVVFYTQCFVCAKITSSVGAEAQGEEQSIRLQFKRPMTEITAFKAEFLKCEDQIFGYAWLAIDLTDSQGFHDRKGVCRNICSQNNNSCCISGGADRMEQMQTVNVRLIQIQYKNVRIETR